MIRGFILDENLDDFWQEAIVTRYPSLSVEKIGLDGCPPRGTVDPDILDWCESRGYALVTNNRTSMPKHLADFEGEGRTIVSIFIVDREESILRVAEALYNLSEASLPGEYANTIRYLSEFY